ncbi:hypothetical protein IV203_007869 [Nitzschia inconspicua]|uniref:DUF6824 domain-containing protein n=1 Tax=Nitzschia inconspicua TaxID=303405 RepID=A0A9K3PM56_9STRA|nr:hypothetical protein IV203_007869 [Nitzschia inconspicua]
MFDFFRGSDETQKLPLSVSSSSAISKSSLRASAIFPDSGSGSYYSDSLLLSQSIPTISEEHIPHQDDNDKNRISSSKNKNNKDNNQWNLSSSKLSHLLNSPRQPAETRRQSTNLLPENQGIAYQRSMIDELEHQSGTVPPLDGVTKKLQSMSIREQERAMCDMYAATPEVILAKEASQTEDQWVDQMDAAIARKTSSSRHHPALQLAMHTDLQYVKDQRWKFLRAEDWNVDRAVERMSKFMELKLEAFGSERLCRELRLDDLTPQDMIWWRETGFLQVLDEKDRSGRQVVFLFGKAQMPVPVDTVIRVSMYLFCLLANDIQCQKYGMVLALWGNGQPFLSDPRRATAILRAWRCFPLRSSAKHFCYDNYNLKPLIRLMAQEWNPYQNVRFRSHYGSAMECIYNLTTFGISRNSVPVREDGSVTLDYHHAFLNALETREKAERLLISLSRSSDGAFNEPFLTQKDQEDLLQQMWMEDLTDDNDDPLPMDIDPQTILPEDVIARLTRSSDTALDPIPLQSSLLDLEGIPLSFLSRLARASFLRSGQSSSNNGHKNNDITSGTGATSSKNGSSRNTAGGTSEYILAPGPLDVIMGRGRHNRNKPGNRKLQEKLEENYEVYENADKFQKTAVAISILTAMKEEGSRFLVREGGKERGIWVQVSDEKARDKIAHDFRNMRGTTANNKDNATAIGEKRQRSTSSPASSIIEVLKRPFGL